MEPTLDIIPEIYFSKLQLKATLLEGEESYDAAQLQKNQSACVLLDMLIIIGKRLKEKGEIEKANVQFKIAQKVMEAFKDDFVEEKWYKKTFYGYTEEERKEVERLLGE